MEEALAAYEVTRAANALEAESQSQNGSDGDNRNGRNGNGGDRNDGDGNGRDGNGGNGNGGNENPNENDRGVRPVARKCTYQDFMKCQPLNFKGMEGVVRLIRTVRTEDAFAMSWRELMKLITKVYCLRNEIQRMESKLWNLTTKNNDLSTYTQRIQELTMMCTKMVPKEEDRVEKFIRDVVRIANNLMDQKLKGYAVKNAENKRRAYKAGNNEKRGYDGPLPYCSKCKLHHGGPYTMKCRKCNKVGHMTRDCKNAAAVPNTQRSLVVNQRVPTCFECGRQGHYKNECPKLKNQNRGNKAGKKTEKARGKAHVLGGGEANSDLNVVTCTSLLNNHYDSMLFDSDADQNFVLTTFSTLLDITPDTIDVSYAVEIADRRIPKTNTVLRGCTLGLLGHPFNIDLMPVELSSFDVIIGMDWLANFKSFVLQSECFLFPNMFK
ncbi:reverse transcriptase domain-containing protein [Tanacetum coccineum]